MNIVRTQPPAPPVTYDIIGLTADEYHQIVKGVGKLPGVDGTFDNINFFNQLADRDDLSPQARY